MARLNVNPARVLDSNANPVSGGTRTVYFAGTTTPVTTYSDIAFTTPHPQAIPADAAGFFPEIYLPADQEYKIVDRDSAGAAVWTGDKIRPDPTSFAYKTVTALIVSAEKPRGVGSIWEAGGFRYEEVTSGEHLTTSPGGVKLKVLPGPGGWVDIRAFGATGVAGQDQNTAAVQAQNSKLPIWIPAGFVLEYTTPLVLTAPWCGPSKGNGNPGSATDNSSAAETAELRFKGTGWAVDTKATFRDISVRGDVAVSGQSGVRLEGSAVGQVAGPMRVMEFDGTGIEIGDSAAQSGIYFADIRGLDVNNQARLGACGVRIIGGGASSSNANIFTGLFISGNFTNYLTVKGHNNTFLNADVNPHYTAVGNLGGTISEGVLIEGDGNTFINPYFEPEFNFTGKLVRFTATSSGNRIENLYTPSGGKSTFAAIEDLGTANSVSFTFLGENFAQDVGAARSARNLIPNPGFNTPDGGATAFGWQFTDPGITIDSSVVRGFPRTLKMTTNSSRTQANCWVASTSPISVRNALRYYPVEMLRGQTLAAGVWALSTTKGMGCLRIDASGAIGTATHSGSGQWEFLTLRTRVPDGATNVALSLRNNEAFSPNTGTVWFSEPVLVLGNEIPRFGGHASLDAETAILTGSFSWNPPLPFANSDTTPSVANGSLFTVGNTAATTISQFDDGREGQEITLVATTGNTTVSNNANIATTTGAAKALAANRVYRFVRANSKWYEVG